MNPDANAATPEDEAFEELEQLEQRLQEQKFTHYMQRAQKEAARFIYDTHRELGLITLRKAFEIGYLRGCRDTEKPTGSKE
jgi:hypothetical protein